MILMDSIKQCRYFDVVSKNLVHTLSYPECGEKMAKFLKGRTILSLTAKIIIIKIVFPNRPQYLNMDRQLSDCVILVFYVPRQY